MKLFPDINISGNNFISLTVLSLSILLAALPILSLKVMCVHLHLKQIVVCIIAECARCNFVSFQRSGTVDSVMSNRPFSRPNTSNTLVLPRSVFFCIAQHLGALSHNLVMDAQGHI